MAIRCSSAFLTLILGWILAPSPAEAAPQNLHVFIVSIGEYEDKAAFPSLTGAKKRADEVTAFFRDAYKLPNQQIHLYSDRTGNATEGDLTRLPKTIETIAKDDRSVVFLFVMAHGRVVASNEFSEDLLIVASDTSGAADKAQPERVMGGRFFQSFAGVGSESVIFAFFDTCSSGALSSAGERFGSTFKMRHQRVVAVASSNANQDSYDFAFTGALLSKWRENVEGCVRVDSLPDTIKLAGQDIRVVSTDNEICLNAISDSKAMLFVLPNSAGPSKMSVLNAAKDVLWPQRPVQRTDVLPFLAMLPRTTVHVQVHDADGRIVLWNGTPIDLTNSPISFQALRRSNIDPYAPREIGSGVTFGMQSPIAPERTPQ